MTRRRDRGAISIEYVLICIVLVLLAIFIYHRL